MSRDLTLATRRLLLRPVRASDVDDIYRNIANWNVVRRLATAPWPYERRAAQAFADRLLALPADEPGARLMITEHDRVIGGIGFGPRGNGDTMFVGYWLGEPHWGRGLMSEAFGEVCRHIFATSVAPSVESGFFSDNAASWRVQQKLGFVQVGEGLHHCVSLKADVPETRTRLTRETFESRLT